MWRLSNLGKLAFLSLSFLKPKTHFIELSKVEEDNIKKSD